MKTLKQCLIEHNIPNWIIDKVLAANKEYLTQKHQEYETEKYNFKEIRHYGKSKQTVIDELLGEPKK
jgi:hypothetical protein